MRIEIHRWKMAFDSDEPGMIEVGYDLLVPIEDVPAPALEGDQYRILKRGRYFMHYPRATWATDLPKGWERYTAWLEHERRAKAEMLAILKAYCPEAAALTAWPETWATVPDRSALTDLQLDTALLEEDTPIADAAVERATRQAREEARELDPPELQEWTGERMPRRYQTDRRRTQGVG